MKTIFTVLCLLTLAMGAKAQSADFTSHNIYCENITSIDASNQLKNYLLTTYHDRISSYVATLDEKTALITTNLAPIDLLQLYRQQGYVALYINNQGRFQLNDGGDQMIWIKE